MTAARRSPSRSRTWRRASRRCSKPCSRASSTRPNATSTSTPTTAATVEEVKDVIENRGGGFVKTMWCGDEACELKMKELAGVTSRCIPFEQEHLGDTCPRLRPRRQEDDSLGRGVLSGTTA